MSPGSLVYNLLYVGFIFFFCYFYTAVTFNPVGVAENLKKQGGYIPGIRPGRRTADYIDRVLTRITLGGAIYLRKYDPVVRIQCLLRATQQRCLREVRQALPGQSGSPLDHGFAGGLQPEVMRSPIVLCL